MAITLDGTTGIVAPAIDVATPITVSDGGTGASTLTSNNVLLGAGTSAVTFVAPGSSGNVLTSNGTTWASTAAGGGQLQTELFTAPGTWTKPTSATQVRVTVIGGGGGGGAANAPAAGISGGTSSFGPAVSATGGTGSPNSNPSTNSGTPGTGTVSVGTAIKTGVVALVSPVGNIRDSIGTIIGLTNRTASASAGAGVAYSTSSTFLAGVGGGANVTNTGGYGGLAIAIVPVTAPVAITVGTGGPTAQAPFNAGGVGGAILVEFVG